VLSLLQYYQNEDSYTVWADLITNLDDLATLMSTTKSYEKWTLFCQKLFLGAASKVGWDKNEGESHAVSLMRPFLLSQLGSAGHLPTIEEARKRLTTFLHDNSTLAPDLRSTVYKINLEHGDVNAYDAVLSVFHKTDLHEEKERCMCSLGYTKDTALLKRTLDFAMSEEIRSQDKVFVIGAVAGNPAGLEMAWQFLQDNWEELSKIYSGGFLLSRLLKSCTQDFSTEERAIQIEKFFAAHPAPAAERTLKQSVEHIRSNASWLERDGHAIEQWLNDWMSKQ